MKTPTDAPTRRVRVTVNGTALTREVECRKHLVDFLREDCGLKGSHLGCEHGVCGACTVQIDGVAQRACLTLAVQVDGREVRTVEGLAEGDAVLSDLQAAFKRRHALQCGFCTPGILVAAKALLERNPDPTDTEIRYWLAGNLCRCTGYDKIIRAVQDAAAELRGAA